MDATNQEQVGKWVQDLVDKDDLHRFYTSRKWTNIRKEILIEYKNECQHCKIKGFYTKATHVHHMQHVRKHPRLALSKVYVFKGIEYKNLIPLCKKCHEEVHNYGHKKKELLTEEKW